MQRRERYARVRSSTRLDIICDRCDARSRAPRRDYDANPSFAPNRRAFASVNTAACPPSRAGAERARRWENVSLMRRDARRRHRGPEGMLRPRSRGVVSRADRDIRCVKKEFGRRHPRCHQSPGPSCSHQLCSHADHRYDNTLYAAASTRRRPALNARRHTWLPTSTSRSTRIVAKKDAAQRPTVRGGWRGCCGGRRHE